MTTAKSYLVISVLLQISKLIESKIEIKVSEIEKFSIAENVISMLDSKDLKVWNKTERPR